MTKLFAHRGGAGYHVENTLAAFEFAIELGCEGAELDVHLTKDQQVVVHHNTKLNHQYTRKPNGQWLTQDEELDINEFTLEELKQYKIGEPNPNTSYHNKFPKLLPVEDQTIPTLQEVIQLAKEKSVSFRLLIEIKTDIFSDNREVWQPLVEGVLALITQEDFTERAEYCSFDWRALIEIKQHQSNAKTWFTTHPLDWLVEKNSERLSLACGQEHLKKLRAAFATGQAPWYAGYQPRTIEAFPQAISQAGGDVWFGYWRTLSTDSRSHAHKNGLEIAGWTNNLNDAKNFKEINELNLDLQCIDFPKYHFTDITDKIKYRLAQANDLRKIKKWEESKKIYENIFSEDGLNTPVEVYKGLAVCHRMLGNYEECQKILNRSLQLFPNKKSLVIESAALLNDLKEWKAASVLWKKILFQYDDVSSLDVSRSLKALKNNCEILDVRKFASENKFLYDEWVKTEFKQMYASHKYSEFKHSDLFFLAVNFCSDSAIITESFCNIISDIIANTTDIGSSISNYLVHKVECNYEIKKTLQLVVFEMSKTQNYSYYLVLSNLYLSFFDFKHYKYARDLAKNALINVFNDNKYYVDNLSSSFLITYMGVLAEINSAEKYEEINKLYLKLNEPVKSKIRPPLRALNLLYEGHNFYIKYRAMTIKNDNELSFKNYIENKSIAIVGPIDTGLLNGDEIDSYDVVIRFNYTQDTVLDDKAFGSRTNITYYTNPAYRKLVRNENQLSKLDWVIPQSLSKLNNIFNSCSYRPQYRSSNSIFLKSYGNAFQRLLLDILRFKVKNVKLFNMNFWLTPHEKNYRAARSSFDSHTVIHHDLLSNHNFIKVLYGKGIIQVDSVIKDIITMGDDRYIDELSKRYSNKSHSIEKSIDPMSSFNSNKARADFKMNITGLHIRDTDNIGDKYCHPLDYFKLGCEHDVNESSFDVNKFIRDKERVVEGSDVLIVGGGAISRKCPSIMKKVMSKDVKVVAWGVGYTNRNKFNKIKASSHYEYRSGFALYGTRDYLPHSGLDYVPCVSCMHYFFDKIPEPTREVVVYSHHDLMLLDKEAHALGIPYKNNKDELGFLEVMNFLASGKKIVTSSYHGAYWGTLLGREVAMIPFGTKFMNLKYRPPIVKSVQEGVEKAISFPEALSDSRMLNIDFYNKVRNLIWRS